MTTATWRRAISQAPREFLLSKLNVIEGSIPKSLNGSLYRNGPGRLERGGQPMGHWFDGDGSILGVHFKDGEARGAQRFVQTDGYKEEEAANKLLFASFGLPNAGPFWNKLTGRKGKNPANTSVLPLPNRLLALWEGGWPHALDLETLETIGIDSLGMLEKGMSFSAHPKVDPVTGDIYNIGFKSGKNSYLCFYKLDKNGKKVAETKISNRMNMVHDFTLAGRYIVVMNFPTEMQGVLGYLLGYKSFNEILHWNPSLGTEVIVLDRNDLSLVTRFKTDPFYAFHFTNGYEDKDGSIYVEFCKYNSFPEINEFLTGVPNLNSSLSSFLGGRLTYMKIDPKKGRNIEMKELADGLAEFPTVADPNVGERWRYSLYASEAKNRSSTGSVPNSIARYDYNTQTMKSFDYGENQYVSEPLLISSEQDPENGNILAVVYDAKEHKSELWIHDSENLEKDPLCRIALPEVIPPGFHGRWKNN